MIPNQNGRSMVEMLGVLAIIGILSVGAVAGYTKASFNHKINRILDEMNMISHNYLTVCGVSKNCVVNDGETAVKMGIVPKSTLKDGTVYNIAGESVDFRLPAYVTYNLPSVDYCIAVASKFKDVDYLTYFDIGGLGDHPFYMHSSPKNISVSDITQVCYEQFDGNGVYIEFGFW